MNFITPNFDSMNMKALQLTPSQHLHNNLPFTQDQAVRLQQLQPNIQINFYTHLHNQLNIMAELWKFWRKVSSSSFISLSRSLFLSLNFRSQNSYATFFWLIFRYLWRNICDSMPKGNWKSNRTFISSSHLFSLFLSLVWLVSTLIQRFYWLFWLSKRVHRMVKYTMSSLALQ